MIDQSVLFDLLKMTGAGLVAGLFSAFMGSKDHRFKKWWELRVVAYQAVIDALSDMVYGYESKFRAEIEGRELTKETEARLSDLISEAFTRVRKASDSGAFLFSNEANEALAQLMNTWNDDHETYQDRLDSMQSATKQCLSRFVSLSKKDLSLNRHFLIWK